MREKGEVELRVREDLRQVEHLVPVVFAFLLPYLPYWGVVALAFLAMAHALFISPRLIRITTRQSEASAAFSRGKVYYALGILVLVLIFPERLDVVAAVWTFLAVGDSASNIFGRRWGRIKLPWNATKSWVGLMAFWIAGTLVAIPAAWWNRPPSQTTSWIELAVACAIAGLLCAFGESLPQVIDDNLVVVWIGAVTFPLSLQLAASVLQLRQSLTQAAVVTLLAAASARLLGWISWRGTVMAALFGMLFYAAFGLPGFLAPLVFVVLASVATKAGFARKQELRIAEGEKGQRGLSNVLANGLVAVLIAVFALWVPGLVLKAAFLAAVATAAFDTVATEIGQWLGRHAFNPLTLRAVAVGTQGAVSWEGTAAGMLAASIVVLVPLPFGWMPVWAVPVIWLSASAASFWESITASMTPGRPRPVEGSDATLNLLSTFFGATAAAVLCSLLLVGQV